jgi:hypothetical protein
MPGLRQRTCVNAVLQRVKQQLADFDGLATAPPRQGVTRFFIRKQIPGGSRPVAGVPPPSGTPDPSRYVICTRAT